MLQKGSRIIIFLICLFFLAEPVSRAGSSHFHEYRIKAAFLYNFANFVEWPTSAFADGATPIVMGVLGQNQLVEFLNAANLKPVRGRKILAKRFENLADYESCHILFVDRSEKDRFQKILNKVKTKTVLSVSDIPGFAKEGGIINFLEVDDKIRFEINVQAAKKANLIISSKLLNLAVNIVDPSTGENN